MSGERRRAPSPQASLTTEALVNRERHARSIWYWLVAVGLAMLSYLFLGFGQLEAGGYAISCFVMLNLANRAAMYSRRPDVPAVQADGRE